MNFDLRTELGDTRAAVRANVPLASYTHLRIGGAAEWFVEPLNEVEVGTVIRVCREREIPLRVLGGGSNVVVADEGVRGVVLHLGQLNRVTRDDERLTAGAGVSLPTLLRGARELGLAGLESLTGIPAFVGGVVAMNAGTREGETFDHLVSLTVVDADGEIRVLGRSDFAPTYRDGGLGDRICLHATWELRPDTPKAIYDRFESYLKYRNSTQPVAQRSVGCVFKNPDGESAGRLIDEAGCKGLRRGGVEVSAKHANYFVNDESGTAADFRALMADVRSRVHDRFGVQLVTEVKLWGFDDAVGG